MESGRLFHLSSPPSPSKLPRSSQPFDPSVSTSKGALYKSLVHNRLSEKFLGVYVVLTKKKLSK